MVKYKAFEDIMNENTRWLSILRQILMFHEIYKIGNDPIIYDTSFSIDHFRIRAIF